MAENNVNIATRVHPYYEQMLPKWQKWWAAYRGGEEFAQSIIRRYPGEGDEKYIARRMAAWWDNDIENLVRLIFGHFAKDSVLRSGKNGDYDQLCDAFMANVDGKGTDMTTFVVDRVIEAFILGRCHYVIERAEIETLPSGKIRLDKNLDPKNLPYCYPLMPLAVRDMSIDKDGRYAWVIVKETVREDGDFLAEAADVVRYRVWTAENWYLYSEGGEFLGSGVNAVMHTPVSYRDFTRGDTPYCGISAIRDIIPKAIEIANEWSNADEIARKQAFSQLVMSIGQDNMREVTETTNDGIIERQRFLRMGLEEVLFIEAGSEGSSGGDAKYIAPDASQLSGILDKLKQMRRDLYAPFGLGGDISDDVKVESGRAREVRLNILHRLLSQISSLCQSIEMDIWDFFGTYTGIEKDKLPTVSWPTEFSVATMSDKIDRAERLINLTTSNLMVAKILEDLFAAYVGDRHMSDAEWDAIMAQLKDAAAPDADASRDANRFPFDNTSTSGGE